MNSFELELIVFVPKVKGFKPKKVLRNAALLPKQRGGKPSRKSSTASYHVELPIDFDVRVVHVERDGEAILAIQMLDHNFALLKKLSCH